MRTAMRGVAVAAVVCVLATSAASVSEALAGQDAAKTPVPVRVYAASYPHLAHLLGTQGEVRLAASVSPSGSPDQIRALSGPGLLIDPAKEMLAKWAFTPCGGGAASCEVRISFRFILDPGLCGDSDCPQSFSFDSPDTITIRSVHRKAIVD